jgi:hypothetical protein
VHVSSGISTQITYECLVCGNNNLRFIHTLEHLTDKRQIQVGIECAQKQDFKVFDNGHQVQISTFDAGDDARQIILWFVVLCNEGNNGQDGRDGSGLFSGKETLFRPALDKLNSGDRVAVGHWCDDGSGRLDLLPTRNFDLAISTLEQVLKPMGYAAPAPPYRRQGQLALRGLIQGIISEALSRDPRPLPVLLVLLSDQTGLPPNEVNPMINDLLETSGILFGIKDSRIMSFMTGTFDNPGTGVLEQGSVLHFISEATGGQYFSVSPKDYAKTLENILIQLHGRYELGFKPPAVDGNRHRLKVELTHEAENFHKSVRLRYRSQYIPMKP